MGINYHGKCTGVSGGKYNLWLNVSENSQNVNANKSNVTIKLLLKRNDGYSASAYNLNESSNTARLTVGGSVKVNKNLAIDTRNGATVTLAQWTGDVSHNGDGTLSLSVSGDFTMGSNNLTGGAVNCSFKCTTIPRASAFAFSAAVVNPGGEIKATIYSASKSFTHKINFGVGDKSVSVDVGAGVSEYTMSIPKEWASQVTDSARGTLKITLKTYNNGVHIGSTNRNIPFIIPEISDYKPDFNIALQRLDNGVPEGIDQYVKGISRLKIDLTDVTFKCGASFGSVAITVGDITKRSVPSVFELTKSGEVKITVSFKDSRGFITEKTDNITVSDYKAPSVRIKSIERCDEDGALNSQGKYLVVDYSTVYSSLNGKNNCDLLLHFKDTKTTCFGDSLKPMASPFVFGGFIEEGSSYEVEMLVKDEICNDYIGFTRSVPVAAIPFNIRRGGKGAAFGKFAERENELSVAWDLNLLGNLKVSGVLNYEEPVVETTANGENLTCVARYFPPLRMVWLGLRVQATKELSANVSHTVAKIQGKTPAFFTPLQGLANYENGGQGTGGILNTGEVSFRSDVAIAKGTYIYISGIYITKE